MLEILALLLLITLVSPFIIHLWKDRGGYFLALFPLIAFIYFLFNVNSIANNKNILQTTPWFTAFGVNLSFYIDGLSLLFALLITGIGTIIVIYSVSYLKNNPELKKYYAYLLLFTFSMLGLVLASNLITLFIFWELTAVSSYLLIGFDSHKPLAREAAQKAFLVTNAGSLALLVGFVLISGITNSYELTALLKNPDILRENSWYPTILILICLGAFTKSAQFPFHFWLPAAMQAPTPISAYLHSATMVQAGVYLLARMHPFLAGSLLWFTLLASVGAITMFCGIILAMRERDLKLMLAYTTVSALGSMVFMLASEQNEVIYALVAFIFAHAMYKSSLFLATGNIQYNTQERDIYRMHGLMHILPITFISVVIAASSMAGIPPLLGFYVKELLYEAQNTIPVISQILISIVVLTNMGLVMLSMMMIFKPFPGKAPKKVKESQPGMYISTLIPGIITVFFGILPFLIDKNLLTPAASAIQNLEQIIDLKLWHGINASLLLSIITLMGGMILYLERQRVLAIINYFKYILNHGPELLYTRLMQGLVWLAESQTAIIQNGRLAIYLLVTLSFVSLTLGISLITTSLDFTIKPIEFSWYSMFLLVWLIICAIATVTTKSLITGVIFLGAFGLGVALFFLVNAAPDVAMTQVLVETLFVIIFVLTLYKLPQIPSLASYGESRLYYISKLIVAILTGVVVTTLLLIVISMPMNNILGNYFIENSVKLGHGRNIVNVILVDFRSFDTMGEVVVLVIAALGVYGLIKHKLEGKWL